MVTLLTVGGVKALFTGDLEAAGERLLVASGHLNPVDILKVGHHGSKTSTTPDFLERIRPKLAIISVGKHNTYGHPAPVTLANLAKWGVKVLTTADIGNIDIVTDGRTYWQHTLH
jgi:competence protein ComEC